MTYRPWLEESALRQMAGLPDEAFDTLARLLSRICDDPYERLLSVAVTDDGRSRMAELGDTGFITFAVDEGARLIRVFDLAAPTAHVIALTALGSLGLSKAPFHEPFHAHGRQ